MSNIGVGFLGRAVGLRAGGGGASLTLNYNYLLNSGSTIAASVVAGPTPTFTRAGNGMSFDSAGNLSYAPHQLLENANLSSQSGSPLAPSGWAQYFGSDSTYDDQGDWFRCTAVAANDRPFIENVVNTNANTVYTIGAYIVSSNITAGNDVILRSTTAGTGATNGDITDADWDSLGGVAGWYAVGVLRGSDGTTLTLQMNAGTAGNATGTTIIERLFIIKGLLPGVGVNVPAKLSGEPLGRWVGTDDGDEPLYDQPRYAHDPADSDAQLGLLMEEARTNLQINSQAFDNAAWTKQNSTINADDITAPDGNSTADRFTDDATNSWHRTFDAITLATDTDCAFSVYAKAGTKDFIFLSYSGTPENHIAAVFDVSSGSSETTATETDVGTTSGTIASTHQTDLGNGWFRCTIVGKVSEANVFFLIGTAEAGTGNTFASVGSPTYAGTSQTCYLWQADAQAGTFPLSPIPTTTATVTRAKDVCSTTDSSWWNYAASTVYVEYSHYVPASVAYEGQILRLRGQGAGAEVLGLNTDTGAADMDLSRSTAGNDASFSSRGPVAANTVAKAAMAVAQDDAAVSLDGAAVATDNTVDPGDEASWKLGVGMREDESFTLNGHVRAVKFWNVRKDNAFLVTETT